MDYHWISMVMILRHKHVSPGWLFSPGWLRDTNWLSPRWAAFWISISNISIYIYNNIYIYIECLTIVSDYLLPNGPEQNISVYSVSYFAKIPQPKPFPKLWAYPIGDDFRCGCAAWPQSPGHQESAKRRQAKPTTDVELRCKEKVIGKDVFKGCLICWNLRVFQCATLLPWNTNATRKVLLGNLHNHDLQHVNSI